MSIHAKKISGCVIAAFSTAGCLMAQVPPAAAPTITVPITSIAPANSKDTLDYALHDRPSEGSLAAEQMNLEKTTKLKELAQEALGFSHVSDEFVRYLQTAELPNDQVKAYQDELAVVQDMLEQRRTSDAWKELPKLAQFDRVDAGISGEIANRVQSVSDADRTMASLDRKMDALHDEAARIARNVDMSSDVINDKQMDLQRRMAENGTSSTGSSNPSSGSSSGSSGSTGTSAQSGTDPAAPQDNSQITNAQISPSTKVGQVGQLEVTTQYLDELHTQAKLNYDRYSSLHIQSSSKTEFQDYIATLFRLGRFQNVIIAADFWRQIFNQGDYPVAMAEQVTQSLENQSLVKTDLDAFQNSIDAGDLKSATESLQEAFKISPFDPGVQAISKTKKRTIQVFVRDLSKVQNMIESEDFGDLETMLDKMKESAPDFDSTKAMAMVNGVKLESRLHLGKARLFAQENNLKDAMVEFQEAAEAWPSNPDLTKSSDGFFDSQDGKNQAVSQFDHLVAEGNYQAAAENQVVLAQAVKDDPTRREQLKNLVSKAMLAETSLEKAKALQAGGDTSGAWETLQLATADLPDDVKLNSLRADLAGQAADFVSAIDKAQAAENREEYGYSLTWYAVAQQSYPASQIANTAIDRLSKKIMEKASLSPRVSDSNGVTSPTSATPASGATPTPATTASSGTAPNPVP